MAASDVGVLTVLPPALGVMSAPAVDPDSDASTRVLMDLTDEELLAVDGPEQGIVQLPYLDRVGAPHLEEVRATALRSLCARGLVRLPEAGASPYRVALAPDLEVLLTARRHPDAVMAVHRLRGGPQGPETLVRYVHRCGPEILVEDVSPSGIHRFALAGAAQLAELMGTFLAVAPSVPTAVTPAGRPARPAARPAEYVPARDGLTLLADVHVVAEIIVRLDPAPVDTSRAAYVFPDVAYVGHAPLDDPRAVVLRPMPLAELGGWAAEALVPAGTAMGQSDA